MSHRITSAAHTTRRLIRATAATLIAAAALLAQAPASAEDKPWNEAVTIDKDGKRKVIVNRVNRGVAPKVPKTWEPGEASAPRLTWVIEGPDGLVECTGDHYREDGTCNPFHPGMYAKKRSRAWVVLRDSKWWECPKPEIRTMCATSVNDCIGPKADMRNRCFPLERMFPVGVASAFQL